MAKLFETAIVEKRNVLNELRSNNMSLQELRFFSIYLAKINPYDISTRVVRFPLNDFRKIMGLKDDMNISHFKYTVRHILQQIVEVPNENGSGYRAFQLFKEAVVEKDENEEWYVEFDAHDKALPLMFAFKNKYFQYELWNALRLKSPNQIRMYEILKQYENLGIRELSVVELRSLLGIASNEYTDRTGWSNFKKKVLDSCQQALQESTDICYTYERGKVGRGGKWLSIIFHIQKNIKYKDPLTLREFIQMQPDTKPIAAEAAIDGTDMDELVEIDYGSKLGNLLGEAACNNEFSVEQVRLLQDLVLKAAQTNDKIAMCDYLIAKVHKMNLYNPQKEKRFTYLCSMIENDIKETNS